jgi:glutamate-1-semialdehyde 2,1-aminomutase
MMAALRLARGYTGRPKFIKFEGQYHGWHDDFLVNSHPQPIASLGHRRDPIAIADSSGLNRRALEDTIVVPWNDIEAARRAVETHGRQIAAIVTEGIMANMGVIPPAPGYLEGLQGLAREIGALFVLDETVTGFRIGLTGCAGHYGLDPDIRAFGKALGGGLPVAAIVGRAEIMEAMAWGGVLHYGTQNASRVGMHAARANLRALSAEGGAAIEKARSIGERLAAGLNRLFEERGERAVVQGVGPMLQILFTERPAIRDYREFCAHVDRAKFQRLAWALFKRGVYMSPAAALHSVASAAHEPADVAATIEAVAKALDEIENG